VPSVSKARETNVFAQSISPIVVSAPTFRRTAAFQKEKTDPQYY